ncbi:unnamed protein product [Hyaloperonospora brassicae]|uniref:PHD-type domain-containing protein n=1 Tax=Hyaloperonospora brassicae TaxID=162125 RepID=A0AAV0TK85_HYABA|nr:unnamed protein product [Hyaloperonospora brassicae]
MSRPAASTSTAPHALCTSAASAAVCCICMEREESHATRLVQCRRCAICVHVKCYGVRLSSPEAPTWLCQACASITAATPAPTLPPQCAVCPIAGGALRRTNQRDVWCHVLCINWIPELFHSLQGTMDEAVDISLLDKSRSALRCLICGLRGGCIQCVSGRCAKAFHVLCAFRCPSSLLFTGYTADFQQVYHCKLHLSDVPTSLLTSKHELVDTSWLQLPAVQTYVQDHPVASDGKCRFCSTKVAAGNKDGHETQCLLGWLARQDALHRKQEMHRLGLKPVEIVYQKKDTLRAARKGVGKSRRKRSPRQSQHGKHQRPTTPVRECPECGAAVRETLMMGHLRKNCSKSRHAATRKNNLVSPRNLVYGVRDDAEAANMSGVLFASWPGQNSGAPMDSAHFWKVVEKHYFSSSTLEKKSIEQLSKSLCGVKLEEFATVLHRRPVQPSDMHCRDTMRFERDTAASKQPLVLRKVAHKCDFVMRASHCRCLSDSLAKPTIEIGHNVGRKQLDTNRSVDSTEIHVPVDGINTDISVLFGDGCNAVVACKYSMRLARGETTTGQQAADKEMLAISFRHDCMSTLVGFDMQTNKVPLAKGNMLLVSLDAWTQVEETRQVEGPSQWTSTVTHAAETTLTDELTPAINVLIEHLKDTTEKNRYRICTPYMKLQESEGDEIRFQVLAQMTDMYYREFSAWKRFCMSLLVGYSSSECHEHDDERIGAGEEAHESSEDENDTIDDGTCVVCFDGQSPETNPIIFCDRCELAVHQRCYGMAKVPSNEFICDRCLATKDGLDPARDVFCQLCSLNDGAFKRTIDGKWVHIVCALWCPKVWIGNLCELSEISLVSTTNQVRFMNSVEEIDMRIKLASGEQHSTPKHDEQPEVPAVKLGDLCVHCRVACGRTIACCHPGCSTSFHPLCGWYDGLPMTVSLANNRYVYAGGGAGLYFQLFCPNHLPDHYPASERLSERRRRARFRIDSFFVLLNKDNYRSGAKKSSDDESSLLSGSIVQAVLSAENKMTASADGSLTTDWTDMAVCSACFEYCSPIAEGLVDVNMLHRRQFMIRCQYCNVHIHPECCISDIGSSATIFKSNWICERCTQTGDKEVPECIVCNKATDYMMPCIEPLALANHVNPQAFVDPAPAFTAMRSGLGGGQQLWLQAHQKMQREQQGQTDACDSKQPLQVQRHGSSKASSPPSNRWMHVYCGKWQKAKTVKRHHMLCAYAPVVTQEGIATRCELCDEKGGMLANCAKCQRRFHPICAAQKKLYCARSNRTEWKFYCEDHPPPDAAFDINRQTWITQAILGQLRDLRRSLERGRMLLEMSRQRDRQQKRLLTFCKLPLMKASIEVVLKRRPTAPMKEVYYDLTGNTLTDARRRAKAVQVPPRNLQNRPRSSLRATTGGRSIRASKRSAVHAPATPERSSKRQRAHSGSDGLSINDRNAGRRIANQRDVRYREVDSSDDDDDEFELQQKAWADLAVPEEVDDFDFVVAELYPELVD